MRAAIGRMPHEGADGGQDRRRAGPAPRKMVDIHDELFALGRNVEPGIEPIAVALDLLSDRPSRSAIAMTG
jgi:hypothetical protein